MNDNNNDDSELKKHAQFNYKDIILTTIFTLVFIMQIALMFIINTGSTPFLVYTGWIIWLFSLYFALISLFTFKKRGKIEKGKSYIHTTKLVKRGTYAIIRHPQYLGGILFSVSMTLWNIALYNLILSIIIILLTYQWTYTEDKNLIEKFGEEYKIYKERVPRINPILGLIRYFSQKNES